MAKSRDDLVGSVSQDQNHFDKIPRGNVHVFVLIVSLSVHGLFN